MKRSTGNRTKAEQARFDKMKEMRICMACYLNGSKVRRFIEIHHLLSGNKRIGHMATVSLCPWHHRGVWESGLDLEHETTIRTLAEWKALYGPSLAHGSKPFRARYGSDAEMLALQNEFLGEADGA